MAHIFTQRKSNDEINTSTDFARNSYSSLIGHGQAVEEPRSVDVFNLHSCYYVDRKR